MNNSAANGQVFKLRHSARAAALIPTISFLLLAPLVVQSIMGSGKVKPGFSVAALLFAPFLLRKINRSTLTVSDTGLEMERGFCRQVYRWDDVERVVRTKRGLRTTDEIVFAKSELVSDNERPTPKKLESKVRQMLADSRVPIGRYFKDWKQSPVAEYLAVKEKVKR